MYRKMWASSQRTNLICIDSYVDGVLKGRFYDMDYDCIPFNSLSQFLLSMEQMLDEKQLPQAYNSPRTFSSRCPAEVGECTQTLRRGKMATFDLRVLFRQNTSWQGSVYWREADQDQSFRSVLELVMLLDSALRGG